MEWRATLENGLQMMPCFLRSACNEVCNPVSIDRQFVVRSRQSQLMENEQRAVVGSQAT